MLVVEETSQKLLGLYRYERGRVAMGSMSEATYRNNARLLLEGDDCFQVEPLTRTPTLTLTPTPTLTLTPTLDRAGERAVQLQNAHLHRGQG